MGELLKTLKDLLPWITGLAFWPKFVLSILLVGLVIFFLLVIWTKQSPSEVSTQRTAKKPEIAGTAKRELDEDRKQRLLAALQSDDPSEVERAIQILFPSESQVKALRDLVNGVDEEVASVAISALRPIGNRESILAIVGGLKSSFAKVRRNAALTLGEMALFGHREDVASHVDSLSDLLTKETDLGTRKEVTHTLAKIGGDKALESLLRVLASTSSEPDLLATALHGPGRFWTGKGRPSFLDLARYEHFVSSATVIIRKWDPMVCRTISETSPYFKYLDEPIRFEVERCAG